MGARGGRSRHRSRSNRKAESRAASPRLRSWACAAAVAVAALAPVSALADATPSPSLDRLLAAPPATDYAQEAQGSSLEGDFDVTGYVSFLTTNDTNNTKKTLLDDGFLHGFGRTWIEEASNHLLLEAAIAFKGSAGAKKWLSSAKTSDESDRYYKGPIAVEGIDSYYGVHFADPTAPAYADVVSFVKGNDYFIVGFVSAANDLGDTASKQSEKQYVAAPAYTIPPSQWPERPQNAAVHFLTTLPAVAYGGAGAAVILTVAALAVAAVLIARRRRGPRAVPVGSLMMSNDGHWWWDGDAWRESGTAMPPGVLRSDDGHYWWDGARWQPVPPGTASQPGQPGTSN